MPRNLFIRQIQARRAARLVALGYAIAGLVILLCWGIASSNDYADARRLECAQIDKFWDSQTDRCVRHLPQKV